MFVGVISLWSINCPLLGMYVFVHYGGGDGGECEVYAF